MTVPTRDRRGWLALACCLLGVLTIAMFGGVVERGTAERVDSIAIGGIGRLQHYDLRLDSVHVTRAVRAGATGPLRPTAGAFVVTRWTALNARDSVPLEPVEVLTTDGRRFAARHLPGSQEHPRIEPGFRRSWTTVHDIPLADLGSAQVRVAAPEWIVPVYRAAVAAPVPAGPILEVLEVAPDEVVVAR